MKNTRQQRPSADETRVKILKNALDLFMQHGFAGTSMSKLAEKADINQSLIFHHFNNKRFLWQQVKAHIIASIEIAPLNSNPNTVVEFLCEAIHQRVFLYTKCPKLSRLIGWQRLEQHNKQRLSGIPNSITSPEKWTIPIKFLQEKGLLNPKLNPELIIIWLTASIDGMLIDDLAIFKNNHNKQQEYVDMMVSCLNKGLAISF